MATPVDPVTTAAVGGAFAVTIHFTPLVSSIVPSTINKIFRYTYDHTVIGSSERHIIHVWTRFQPRVFQLTQTGKTDTSRGRADDAACNTGGIEPPRYHNKSTRDTIEDTALYRFSSFSSLPHPFLAASSTSSGPYGPEEQSSDDREDRPRLDTALGEG